MTQRILPEVATAEMIEAARIAYMSNSTHINCLTNAVNAALAAAAPPPPSPWREIESATPEMIKAAEDCGREKGKPLPGIMAEVFAEIARDGLIAGLAADPPPPRNEGGAS